ncbi:YicC family protein [Planctomycetales bacterium 10988]|nr:YicC family protein [Planctomycetales bacterium 10988]
MTGYGEARHQADGFSTSVELRTVNNRYFKLNGRLPDGYRHLESEIESQIKQVIRRGTVQLTIRLNRDPQPEDYTLNVTALESYYLQAEKLRTKLAKELNPVESVRLDSLLHLPGLILDQRDPSQRVEKEWPIVQKTLAEAVENLQAMRLREGQAMQRDLESNCNEIASHLQTVDERRGVISEVFRDRLLERVRQALEPHEVTISTEDLIREVAIFTERADISEEVVRLRSHLEQYHKTIQDQESSGRKLDFLTQEMYREINTIGSKANDVEIAQEVVEMKAVVEKMREMVQNLE